VLRVLAENAKYASAPNNPALITHLLYRCLNFHCCSSPAYFTGSTDDRIHRDGLIDLIERGQEFRAILGDCDGVFKVR
jgi:hypothetical protein